MVLQMRANIFKKHDIKITNKAKNHQYGANTIPYTGNIYYMITSLVLKNIIGVRAFQTNTSYSHFTKLQSLKEGFHSVQNEC